MSRHLFSPLSCCLLLLLALGHGLSAEEPKVVFQRTVRATCLVRTDKGWGTGWIIDRSARLIVTNAHVVGRASIVQVGFPQYDNGKLVAERSRYDPRTFLTGQVLERDVKRDLAIIQANRLPDETRELKLSDAPPVPSDRVHSVGNPAASDSWWVYTFGTVRSVYRKEWSVRDGDQLLTCTARVVETQSPLNPGDSGGPVVNDRGQIVAVVCAGRIDAQLVSLCIAASEVEAVVKEARKWSGPKTSADYLERAYHQAEANRYEAAIADCTTAIGQDPSLAEAYLVRGGSLFLLGAGGEEYRKALADMSEAIRLNPTLEAAYLSRAALHRELGDYDQAVTDSREAVRRYPVSLAAQNALADNLSRRGFAFFEKSEFDKSLKDYSEAVGMKPRNTHYRLLRANAYYCNKQFDRAIDDAGEAINLAPTARSYRIRGMAFFSKGELDAAIRDLTEAIRRDPADWMAYDIRGRVYLKAGDIARARGDQDQATRLRPK